MAFFPKKYGDLGKQYRDLQDDDFTYKNSLKVKRKTACGLKFASTAKFEKKGIIGSLKANFKDKELGDVELQASTQNIFNLKVKLSELADGLKSTIKAQLGGKKPSDPVLSITPSFDLSQENFAGSLAATFNENKDQKWSSKVNASAVVGTDGVSLGATFTAKLNSQFEVDENSKDMNVAFELAEEDFTFGLSTETGAPDEKTKEKPAVFNASLFHTVSEDCVNGVLFRNVARRNKPDEQSMTLVSKYAVDDATNLKLKLSTDGTIDTAVTYTLPNPKAQLNFATQFHTNNGTDFTQQAFGLGITLGSI